MHQTVIWNAVGVLDDTLEFSEDSTPPTVTEVVARDARPSDRARMIAVARRAGRLSVVGFGIVRNHQRVATGKDRIRLDPLVRIEPLPFDEIAERLPTPVRHGDPFDLPPPLRPQVLGPQLGQHVLRALAALSRPVAELLAQIAEMEEPITGGRAWRVREERDAVATALDLAGIDPEPDQFASTINRNGPQEPLVGLLDPTVLYDIEDDLIAEDLRRFDRSGTLKLTHASAARFTDRDVTLTIINVNRKSLEKVAGVDLVYWDMPNDSYTMVQYKRLTRRSTPSDGDERWAYTDKSEVMKALDRMTLRQGRVSDATQFRLTTSPYWFKFVRADAFTPNDPMVLRGMYVPAEYVRQAVSDGAFHTGPRLGFEITYANTRYLRRETFVDLVRKSMAGTTSRQTADVLREVNALSEDRQTILAVRTNTAN
jgi:hypothetical protein